MFQLAHPMVLRFPFDRTYSPKALGSIGSENGVNHVLRTHPTHDVIHTETYMTISL